MQFWFWNFEIPKDNDKQHILYQTDVQSHKKEWKINIKGKL